MSGEEKNFLENSNQMTKTLLIYIFLYNIIIYIYKDNQ